MKVSIGIPIYGVEKYIERCAVSLFEQSYNNIEYIFVDDCSPDNSISILKEIVSHYPNRKCQIKILQHEKNQGLAAARNTFVRNATGDFLIHVDSDDWVDVSLVQKCVQLQKETNADLIQFDFFRVKSKSTKVVSYPSYDTPQEYSLHLLTRQAGFSIWGKFIRRSLYLDNHIFVEEGVNMGEDYQVMPRLAYFARRIAFIKEPLYYYAINDSSYSNQFTKQRIDQDWRSFEVNRDFFLGRSHDYEKNVQVAALRIIVTDLVYSARYNNKYYYEFSLLHLKDVDSQIWNTQPLPIRVMLYLRHHRKLMSLYANIATSLKHLLIKAQ